MDTARTARRTARHSVVALAAAATCLAGAAVPASAATAYTLALTGPTAGTVSQPLVLTATSVVPEGGYLNRYVNVYAIPQSVLPSCPTTKNNALNAAYGSAALGGETVAAVVNAPVGTSSAPVVWTPKVAGAFLLCGYLHETMDTDAYAQHVVQVAGGATAPPTPPAPPTPGDPHDGPEAQTAPGKVKAPGLTKVGKKLRCTRGTWSGSPTTYRYAWKVGSRRKAGRATLRITAAVRGKKVSCGVTAVNAVGETSAWSRRVRVR